MAQPQIESYRFGHLIVDGQLHTRDVLILPDRILGNWWRREGHTLHPEDLEVVFKAKPEVLVVGQGAYGRMHVASETRQGLQALGIELIAQPTEQACRSYNHMRADRRVAAALHLTC